MREMFVLTRRLSPQLGPGRSVAQIAVSTGEDHLTVLTNAGEV